MRPRIVVLAGVNGAGKSSVVGAMIRAAGSYYFNPDEATRLILERNPGAALAEANAAAWAEGTRLLEHAITAHKDYTFETTLGGHTIVALLERAADAGCAVTVIYVGLATVEQHMARVRARVAAGGHAIPDARIRARYRTSREHLIRLLPRLHELKVYDNSVEADPLAHHAPVPVLLLHRHPSGEVTHVPLRHVPSWAKPIVMAALKRAGR
ncbi:MAG: AAA family ATPase [Gemmatimonadaceae bacterium]